MCAAKLNLISAADVRVVARSDDAGSRDKRTYGGLHGATHALLRLVQSYFSISELLPRISFHYIKVHSLAVNLLDPAHGLLLQNAALPLHLLGAVLEVVGDEVSHVHGRDEPWSIGEEVVHLFERSLLGLRLCGPEPKGIGEVANHEEDVEAPANFFHGNRGHLADHGVECKGNHDADTDALGACASIENLSWDDPCDGVSLH